MSVRREDYILIGTKFEYREIVQDSEKFYDEDYEINEPYIREKRVGEIAYVIDHMGSEYFIVGEIIEYSGDSDGLGVHTFDLGNGNGFADKFMRVRHHLKKRFGIENPYIELIVVTNWR